MHNQSGFTSAYSEPIGVGMAVTHCVCLKVSFAELHEIAARDGLSFDQLQDQTRCCTGCGICEPYVRLALKTGQTTFRVLSQVTINRVLAEARREVESRVSDSAGGGAE